jgi:threonine/homoserine/homoserine lactone efflux protein
MTIDVILPFFLVCLVATATPGPAILYVLSAGISGGLSGSGRAVSGVLCADALYFLLSVTGLGTLLLASYSLFVLVKYAGAAYLVYLGVRLLWLAIVRPEAGMAGLTQAPVHTRWLSGGFMVHAANPKALLYFGSIVPQFLRPEQPLLPQLAVLGLLHLVTAFGVMFVYGFFASRIRVFAGRPWFSRTLHAASGTMLVAAGAGLASIKQASTR